MNQYKLTTILLVTGNLLLKKNVFYFPFLNCRFLIQSYFGLNIRWFLPKQFTNHHRYIPFGQLCPFNLHGVTHTFRKGESCENNLLRNRHTLRRVQSYSPNLRSLHGRKGVQKLGEDLMDIRTLIKTVDGRNESYIDNNIARDKTRKWISLASKHIDGIRENGGMARLELSFESKDFVEDDKEFEKNIESVIKSFVQSTKIYSGKLVANLAEISLLSFEGISNALLLWFSDNFIPLPLSHNVFAEVWQHLTYFSRNFFSGRRTYETKAYFAPRLGYLFSRPLLNPSWNGINDAMLKLCDNQENMTKLKKYWYEGSNVQEKILETALKINKSLLKINSEFSTEVNAFLDLITTNCKSNNTPVNDAIACSCCKRITSKQNLKSESWKNHLCIHNEGDDIDNWDLLSLPFIKYLKDLSSKFTESQGIACKTIMASNENCFLTGVAGSGKSYVLNFVYPSLIHLYGFTGVSLTATTNVAATNINGSTLSHFLGLSVSGTLDKSLSGRDQIYEKFLTDHIKYLASYKLSVLQNAELCKVVIVDEAGMCDKDVFFFLHRFLQKIKNNNRPFGGVRIILVGDILQLAPIVHKSLGRQGKFFFEENIFKGNFFIAYLRENHRQSDPLFLEALNKVRIGDATVLEYLNKEIYDNNITSRQTLEMAQAKSEYLKSNPNPTNNTNVYSALSYRFSKGYLFKNRNDHTYFMNNHQFENRLNIAPSIGYTDFIVCQEHSERDAYIKFRKTNEKIFTCKSVGTESSPNLPEGLFKSINKKLPKTIDIFEGMPCRITYKTKNPNICANTLVKIEYINVDENGKVVSIVVLTTSPAFTPQGTTLTPVEITEDFNGSFISRTQFPINSAIGVLPWHLQCLTISENIFYDNTRCTGSATCSKGSFYTVMSRVKNVNQFCFLYEITKEEIVNGVDQNAKFFDDKYRLRDGVIFDLRNYNSEDSDSDS